MEKKHMGNNPGISNIQILIETCSQDRYGENGNLWEIREGFVLGLLPSVRNETGLCLTIHKALWEAYMEALRKP
jgi:hypothetical protein